MPGSVTTVLRILLCTLCMMPPTHTHILGHFIGPILWTCFLKAGITFYSLAHPRAQHRAWPNASSQQRVMSQKMEKPGNAQLQSSRPSSCGAWPSLIGDWHSMEGRACRQDSLLTILLLAHGGFAQKMWGSEVSLTFASSQLVDSSVSASPWRGPQLW